MSNYEDQHVCFCIAGNVVIAQHHADCPHSHVPYDIH